MVSPRATKTFQGFMKKVICENIRGEDKLTYSQVGRVAVMVLGTAVPKGELCLKIMKRFDENEPCRVHPMLTTGFSF